MASRYIRWNVLGHVLFFDVEHMVHEKGIVTARNRCTNPVLFLAQSDSILVRSYNFLKLNLRLKFTTDPYVGREKKNAMW